MQNNFLIEELLPSFRKLNDIYQKIIERTNIYLEEQKSITIFYNDYSNKELYEKMIISLFRNSENRNYSVLLENLKTEIEKNSTFYKANTDFFKNINTVKVCQDSLNFHFTERINRQTTITSHYSESP